MQLSAFSIYCVYYTITWCYKALNNEDIIVYDDGLYLIIDYNFRISAFASYAISFGIISELFRCWESVSAHAWHAINSLVRVIYWIYWYWRVYRTPRAPCLVFRTMLYLPSHTRSPPLHLILFGFESRHQQSNIRAYCLWLRYLILHFSFALESMPDAMGINCYLRGRRRRRFYGAGWFSAWKSPPQMMIYAAKRFSAHFCSSPFPQLFAMASKLQLFISWVW